MDQTNLTSSQAVGGSNSSKYAGVAVVVVVLLLLAVGLYYVVSSGMLGGPPEGVKQPVAGTPIVGSPETQVVKPDFAYTVKSIDATTIVLEGLNGEFILPTDAMSVKAYAGLTKDAPAMALTDLKVGDSLNMEFIPGQSADLFVSRM